MISEGERIVAEFLHAVPDWIAKKNWRELACHIDTALATVTAERDAALEKLVLGTHERAEADRLQVIHEGCLDRIAATVKNNDGAFQALRLSYDSCNSARNVAEADRDRWRDEAVQLRALLEKVADGYYTRQTAMRRARDVLISTSQTIALTEAVRELAAAAHVILHLNRLGKLDAIQAMKEPETYLRRQIELEEAITVRLAVALAHPALATFLPPTTPESTP